MIGTSETAWAGIEVGGIVIARSDRGNPVMYYRYPGSLETPSGVLQYRDVAEIEGPFRGQLAHIDLQPVVWDGTDWVSCANSNEVVKQGKGR